MNDGGSHKTEQGQDPAFLDAFLDGSPERGPEPAAERDPDLEFSVIEMLRTIYDPEIPVDIYELGLVYEHQADVNGNVKILMTMPTTHCPVDESMPGEVEKIGRASGREKVRPTEKIAGEAGVLNK